MQQTTTEKAIFLSFSLFKGFINLLVVYYYVL